MLCIRKHFYKRFIRPFALLPRHCVTRVAYGADSDRTREYPLLLTDGRREERKGRKKESEQERANDKEEERNREREREEGGGRERGPSKA